MPVWMLVFNYLNYEKYHFSSSIFFWDIKSKLTINITISSMPNFKYLVCFCCVNINFYSCHVLDISYFDYDLYFVRNNLCTNCLFMVGVQRHISIRYIFLPDATCLEFHSVSVLTYIIIHYEFSTDVVYLCLLCLLCLDLHFFVVDGF